MEKVGFQLIVSILLLVYVIPDQVQIPFKLFLLTVFLLYYCFHKIKYPLVTKREFVTLFLVASLVIIAYFSNTFHPSLIIVSLSIFPLLSIEKLWFKVTGKRIKTLKNVAIISALGIAIQMLFYRYEGRPKMGYEINLSGAYLFIFFLYADSLKLKWGKIFVVILSMFLLSRLLVFSLGLFYLVRFSKLFFIKLYAKFNWYFLISIFFIATNIFSIWYSVNMVNSVVQGNTGKERMQTINDGSNYQRFNVNNKIILSIISNSDENLIIGGYGDLGKSKAYRHKYGHMPHNEMLKAIAQFGIITLVMLLFMTLPIFNSKISPNNLEYFLSILFYTQILWVRLSIVPSIIMILFLLIVHVREHIKKSD